MRKKQNGFTLIELLIVLAVLTVLIALSLGGFTKLINIYHKAQTQSSLNAMASGLQACYNQDAWDIDNAQYTGQATLNVNINGNINTIVNDTPTMTVGTPNQAWLNIGRTYFTIPYKSMLTDGWGTPYYVFVSDPLGNQNGIMYRTIAIVSLGSSHQLQSTFDPSTGTLTLGGTNMGVVVSGAEIETQKYQTTVDLLNKYAKFMDQTFATLFQSDPSKNISVDHFTATDQSGTATAYTDPNSGIANSCYMASDCLETVKQAGIAFSNSSNDNENAWYYPSASSASLTEMAIYLDNWSSNTRNPNDSMPPYTAQLVAYTPWGSQIIVSAIGTTS